MADMATAKRFGEYLVQSQIAITNKRKRMISVSEIAREVGVSQPSSSAGRGFSSR